MGVTQRTAPIGELGGLASRGTPGEAVHRVGIGQVVVCLDRSAAGESALPHAAAIARSAGARLTLLHVLEPRATTEMLPTDPFTWEMRREEAREYLRGVAASLDTAAIAIDVEVVEGRGADQIRVFVRSRGADLTAIGTHGEGGTETNSMGGTARKLVETLSGSLLIVPAAAPGAPRGAIARYARILVPLDGSPRAESVLPIASALARAHEAEVVLVHAVPAPALTRTGPPTTEDVDLERRIHERNARVAESYLSTLAARFQGAPVLSRTVVVEGMDVRAEVLRAAEREGADLVVACAHGSTGNVDRACGSIAGYLSVRTSVPLLLVRELPCPDASRRQAPRLLDWERPGEA
jgi:nucleotide-binding universal stress UspA family protein